MFSVLFLFLIEFLHFFSLHILKTDGFMGERYAISNVVCWRDGDFARFGLRSDMSNVSVWIKCNINRRWRRRQRCRRFGSPYRSSLILSRSLLSYFVSILFLKMYEQLYEFIAAVHVHVCASARIVIPFVNQKTLYSASKWWKMSDLVFGLEYIRSKPEQHSSIFAFWCIPCVGIVFIRAFNEQLYTPRQRKRRQHSYVPLQLCVCFCCVRISPGIQSLCAIVSFSPFIFSITFGFSLSLVSHS